MVSLKEAMKRVKKVRAKSDGIEGSNDAGFYWKPEEEGTQIEGKVVEIYEGEYGDQVVLEVERGTDKVEVDLPAHADLRKKMSDVFEGDYLYVTLKKIIKSTNPDYADKRIYEVEFVPADVVKEALKNAAAEKTE